VPWDSSSLTDRFEFAPPAASRDLYTDLAKPAISGALEKPAYEEAVAVGSCGALEAFIRRYPDSFYAELAKERATSACAAPTAKIAATSSVATATRSAVRDGTCETGPFDVDYCASSVLKSQKTNHYNPGMMFDGNRETAWVEGEKDNGINETLTLHFAGKRLLAGFEIINGYDKTESIWKANARVRSLEATTSDGQTLAVSLQDVRGASRVNFTPAIESDWLELRIKDVYPGAKYKDTAVSELYPVFAD
jgi:hypothetical protein